MNHPSIHDSSIDLGFRYWGAYLVTGLNWLLMLSVTVAACKGQQNEPRNGHYEADVEL